MDQTKSPADFSDSKKYVSKSTSTQNAEVAEPKCKAEEVPQDALLGGIRTGIRTITKTAREALSTCKSRTELDDATAKIEVASLKLLKLEKSFLKTATLVTEIIDDLASDYEGDEASKEGASGGGGDAKKLPYIFHISNEKPSSIANFKNKLTKELDKRLNMYQDTLTDSQLKAEKQFSDLLNQIKLGRRDAEASIDKGAAESKLDDDDDDYDMTSLLNRLSLEEMEKLKDYNYQPYDEDKDMDDSVLPTIDPISKKPIEHPVKNKYCHHVFDRDSIMAYIAANPAATCPVRMCLNCRFLEQDQFITDQVLTAHVRKINKFED